MTLTYDNQWSGSQDDAGWKTEPQSSNFHSALRLVPGLGRLSLGFPTTGAEKYSQNCCKDTSTAYLPSCGFQKPTKLKRTLSSFDTQLQNLFQSHRGRKNTRKASFESTYVCLLWGFHLGSLLSSAPFLPLSPESALKSLAKTPSMLLRNRTVSDN